MPLCIYFHSTEQSLEARSLFIFLIDIPLAEEVESARFSLHRSRGSI